MNKRGIAKSFILLGLGVGLVICVLPGNAQTRIPMSRGGSGGRQTVVSLGPGVRAVSLQDRYRRHTFIRITILSQKQLKRRRRRSRSRRLRPQLSLLQALRGIPGSRSCWSCRAIIGFESQITVKRRTSGPRSEKRLETLMRHPGLQRQRHAKRSSLSPPVNFLRQCWCFEMVTRKR